MKTNRWSTTRVSIASICDRMHYYGYYTNETKLPSAWQYARGRLFHSLARRFYKDGKPFRKSAESFSNTTVAEWKMMIRREDIDWQGINPYSLIPSTREIAKTLYSTYSNQSPAIANELRVNFSLNKTPFIAIFDEVRENLTLRDHKTTPIQKVVMDNDHQPTLYILGFVAALSHDPYFAQINSTTQESASKWLENPESLCEKINFEYHIIKTGEIKPVKRNYRNIEELLDTISMKKATIEASLKQGKLPKANRGYHCNSCVFRDSCSRDSLVPENVVVYQPELFLEEKPTAKLRSLDVKQLKIKFPRKKIKNTCS